MNYTLKMNENGQLHGVQEVGYDLQGMKITETVFVFNGNQHADEGWLHVHNPRMMTSYFFDAKDWGTIEIARDAAEDFCISASLPVITIKEETYWQVKPANEEAFV